MNIDVKMKETSNRNPKRKTILITGASRGIGAAIAKAFAEKGGWNILINCRSSVEELREVEHSLAGYPDTAVTATVGDVSDEAKRLMDVTRESLMAGINAARAGGRIGDISNAVQSYVEARGFSVVRQFVGHGVGTHLHEEPEVPNFGKAGHGIRLMPGMTLAIEPMVNAGNWQVKVLPDGWTTVTLDGSLSAHFEHTVAITPDGPQIMTVAP